jgi:hypothetical protein
MSPFRWFRPKRIDDPVFGQMTNEGAGWFARVQFQPVGHEIEVGIISSVPPTALHHATFSDMASSYTNLLPEIRRALASILAKWAEDLRHQTANEPKLDAIWIRASSTELIYSLVSWRDASLRVSVTGGKVEPAGLDD